MYQNLSTLFDRGGTASAAVAFSTEAVRGPSVPTNAFTMPANLNIYYNMYEDENKDASKVYAVGVNMTLYWLWHPSAMRL